MRCGHRRPCPRPGAATRRGFTLIEILCVVLIIGVLASIAAVKLNGSKKHAYVTAMKADLRNFATSAESRYAMDGSYANVTVPQGSAGVTMTAVVGVTQWTATVTHANLPGVSCTLSYGGTASSEPVCQ